MSPTDADARIEEAMDSLTRLFRPLRAESGTRWLDLDLTLTQVRALFVLAQEGSATISQLARLLGIGNAGTSSLVDRLVKLGLTERSEDPADRRRTIVRLSGKGQEYVSQLSQSRSDWLRSIFAQLPAGDLDALATGLRAAAAVAARSYGRREPNAPHPQDDRAALER